MKSDNISATPTPTIPLSQSASLSKPALRSRNLNFVTSETEAILPICIATVVQYYTLGCSLVRSKQRFTLKRYNNSHHWVTIGIPQEIAEALAVCSFIAWEFSTFTDSSFRKRRFRSTVAGEHGFALLHPLQFQRKKSCVLFYHRKSNSTSRIILTGLEGNSLVHFRQWCPE